MPRHAFGLTVQAAPPPASSLKRSSGPIAAASLSTMITAATAFGQATQNTAILRSRTAEESRMKRVLSCRRKRRRVGQACQVCRAMRAATNVSWPIPRRPCSDPPAKLRPAFSTTLVVVDVVAIPTTRRTATPLWEVTPSRARMRMSSGRHEGNVAGLENFTPYYQPLIPWVSRLRKVVFPNGGRWEREDTEFCMLG